MKRSNTKQRWLATAVLIGTLALMGCGKKDDPAANTNPYGSVAGCGNFLGGCPNIPGGGYYPPGTQTGCAPLTSPISFVGQNVYYSSVNVRGYGAVTSSGININNGGLILSRGVSDGLQSADGAIQMSVNSQQGFNGQYASYPQGIPQTQYSPYALNGSAYYGMGYPQFPGSNIGGVVAQGAVQISPTKLQMLDYQLRSYGASVQNTCATAVALDLGHTNYNNQQVVWGTVVLQVQIGSVYGQGYGQSGIVYLTF